MGEKLILFDIDDTLVRRTVKREIGLDRWKRALRRVYGVVIDPNHHTDYSGWVDWQIGWDLVREKGIGAGAYRAGFGRLKQALTDEALQQGRLGNCTYAATEGAGALLADLSARPGLHLGILSGNLKAVGEWKLQLAGINGYFSFGCFSDNARDRESIARQVPSAARRQLNLILLPRQVTVVGDTVHDVRCGKVIGARTVAVGVAGENDGRKFMAEGADLWVGSLADPRLYRFLTEDEL